MAAPRKYPQELRDRAIRLARESDRPLAHVAGSGDLEDLAQPLHAVACLVVGDELEAVDTSASPRRNTEPPYAGCRALPQAHAPDAEARRSPPRPSPAPAPAWQPQPPARYSRLAADPQRGPSCATSPG